MKNKITLLSIIAALILGLGACSDRSICIKGNGHSESKSFEISDFESVELQDAFDVTIKQGEKFSVIATGDENILTSLQVTKIGNSCRLDFEKGCYKDYNINVEVTMPTITGAELDGSGNMSIGGFNASNDLDLELNGSGNIELNDISNIKSLSAEINGSGNINTHSTTNNMDQLDVQIIGSGSFLGFGATTSTASCHIEGSGNCEVSVSENLSAEITGSGNVLYKGNPKIDSQISGSGRVIDAN